jgi:hypothetical protein
MLSWALCGFVRSFAWMEMVKLCNFPIGECDFQVKVHIHLLGKQVLSTDGQRERNRDLRCVRY